LRDVVNDDFIRKTAGGQNLSAQDQRGALAISI
jgi:hypothetical protein